MNYDPRYYIKPFQTHISSATNLLGKTYLAPGLLLTQNMGGYSAVTDTTDVGESVGQCRRVLCRHGHHRCGGVSTSSSSHGCLQQKHWASWHIFWVLGPLMHRGVLAQVMYQCKILLGYHMHLLKIWCKTGACLCYKKVKKKTLMSWKNNTLMRRTKFCLQW